MTIWTIPAMELRERFRRTGEWLAMSIAAKMPQKIRYWVTLQEIGRACKDSNDVPATPLSYILNNLSDSRRSNGK